MEDRFCSFKVIVRGVCQSCMYCDERIHFLVKSTMEAGSFQDRIKDTFSVFIATVAKNKNSPSKYGAVIQT